MRTGLAEMLGGLSLLVARQRSAAGMGDATAPAGRLFARGRGLTRYCTAEVAPARLWCPSNQILPATAPAVTPPPVRTSCHERAVAQPRTPTTVGIYWGTHEEGTPMEAADEDDTSGKPVNNNPPGKPANNDMSREPVNNDTSVKRMDKGVAGGEAEVPRAKPTEVSETTAKMSETTTAKVSESAAAVTTPHCHCPRGVRDIDSWKGCARLDFRKRQNDKRQRRQPKLMLEHWTLHVLRRARLPPQGVGETRKRHRKKLQALCTGTRRRQLLNLRAGGRHGDHFALGPLRPESAPLLRF
jgi:hypothetical protein